MHDEWAYVTRLLPGDLEETARAYGAIKRRRQITSASALLRLALGYAVCDWSLPIAAASAELMGLGKMSHVAVLKRLRRAGPWLGPATAPGKHLGLAIVASTVEAHGGTVSIGNHPRGGARVTLRLPRADGQGGGPP